ncbi:hypothetical protein REC12_18850 [Desulfosporosinus sp. PR]|uniref:hypothetical protein n=1 Tax=Candidatus Desulfosporosinus nitrosoreducens TaxID=3401928 RepID=UPI0027F1A131|nr:hypothetical protein [Desulfosporosinus sp. PR]MDQ7095652.1 hypothetical protein [Desulfosporosinus sp. PR]
MLDISMLIVLVYSIVETLEKFGTSQRLAHLLAIPLGLICSFLFLRGSSVELIIQGLLIGFGSVGACNTSCNMVDWLKEKKLNSPD